MFGQLDTVKHPAEVRLGLLLVMAVLMARGAVAPVAAVDIVLVRRLMIAHGVVFAELQLGKHLPRSLQSQLQQHFRSYECVFLCYSCTKMDGWHDIGQLTCGPDIQLM